MPLCGSSKITGRLFVLSVLLVICSTGCFRGALSAAQPTALELQILGVHHRLDDDLVRTASFRGGKSKPIAKIYDLELLQAEALRHRAIQKFNADDLAKLKEQGCVRELPSGEVEMTDCLWITSGTANLLKLRRRVIREENQARVSILRWVAVIIAQQRGLANPKAGAVDELKASYARLLTKTSTIFY